MGGSQCKMFRWCDDTLDDVGEVLEEGSLFRKTSMVIEIEQEIPLFMPAQAVSEVREFRNGAGGKVVMKLHGEKRMGCVCDHPVLDTRINQMLMSMLSDEEYLPFPKMSIDPSHLYRQSALTSEMKK